MNHPSGKQLPLIIAHRGASALAPENTLAAFQMAMDLGADGVELDVMLSRDGYLVVIHDDSLERTTNGKGKVGEMPYEQLRGLDAGFKFGSQFVGQHLPTLEEVFDLLGDKLLINVELKNYHAPHDNLAIRVAELIVRRGLQRTTLLSSFNPLNARKARSIDASIPFGLLTYPGLAGSLFRGPFGRVYGYQALHPYHQDVTSRMVRSLHSRAKQCNVWTVDKPADLLRMWELGVDMIICNNPAAARTVLEG